MQSFLWVLKATPPKKLSVYKLVLGLDEITFAGLLFKYVRNTAYRIRDEAE